MNNIKVLHGDCYKVIKAIPSNSIDLVVTDPPYKEFAHGGGGTFGDRNRHYRQQIKPMMNGFDPSILGQLCRVMKRLNLYIWCSKAQIPKLLNYFLGKNHYYEIIKYCKTNPTPACNNSYLPDTEYCLYFREKGTKIYGKYHTKHTYYVMPNNVKDKRKWKHPTIKPLNIIKNLIVNSSRPNDVIFDPFAGSGTGGGLLVSNFIANS